MQKVELFQIHYDERSRAGLDPGFQPWDNSANERPDWAEYWSFRKIWLQIRGNLVSDDYLGVFSPRFKDKTGLSAEQVSRTVVHSNSDVVSFSPYLTHIALYTNVFEQGEQYHPGLLHALTESMKAVDEPIDWTEVVGTFRNTIFSNYFVAKVSVWEELMAWTERLFEIAECGSGELGSTLNRRVSYVRGSTPMKVFVFERLISLLMWRRQLKAHLGMDFEAWKRIKGVTPIQCTGLMSLDALKAQFLETGRSEYLEQFFCARDTLLKTKLNMS